tara:strand:- start:169 stop:774 length:606 start_codon:yes stop_codon:yes gene_type:complete
MKQALLIGCGNERGSRIIDGCHEAGYTVTNIGSSQSKKTSVKNIQINWKDLDLITLHKVLKEIDYKIDFIFFNQNASSLANIDFTQPKETVDTWSITKSWGHSYWLSCQLPYFIIKTLETNLHNETIIGWMLSSFIDKDKEDVTKHPDYSGYKFTNYLIMKNFNNKYPSFGINPEFETKDKIQKLITEICNGTKKCNGEMF